MKKFTHTILMILVLSTSGLYSQLISYTLDEDGSFGTVDAGITATGFIRVNGLNAAASCPDGFSSKDYSTAAAWTSSGPAVQWTVTPNPGYSITVTELTFDLRRNNNGPQKMKFAYSTDGGATWTTSSDLLLIAHGSCFDADNFSWDIADFTTTSAVIFRIYGWAASHPNGVGGIRTGTLGGVACSAPDVPISPSEETFNCRGTAVTFSTDACAGCSYQWYKNDNPIEGATSTSYSTTKGAAHYNVRVTVPGGCSDTSTHVLLTTELNPNANIYSPNGTNLCHPEPGDVILLKMDYNADYTYQWLKDGSPYTGAGATEWRIYPTETGDYRCHVWSPGGSCDRISAVKTVVNDCRLAGGEEALTVFPNPSAGFFTITLNSADASGFAIIEIYNCSGDLIFTRDIAPLGDGFTYFADISNLPAGLYYIRMKASDLIYNSNILIQR